MFTLDDVQKYKAFKTLVKSGNFTVSGANIYTAAVLLQWFESIEKKIDESAKQNIAKPIEAKAKK